MNGGNLESSSLSICGVAFAPWHSRWMLACISFGKISSGSCRSQFLNREPMTLGSFRFGSLIRSISPSGKVSARLLLRNYTTDRYRISVRNSGLVAQNPELDRDPLLHILACSDSYILSVKFRRRGRILTLCNAMGERASKTRSCRGTAQGGKKSLSILSARSEACV